MPIFLRGFALGVIMMGTAWIWIVSINFSGATVVPKTSDRVQVECGEGEWRDLPVASFAPAGTNVPTGMLKIKVPS